MTLEHRAKYVLEVHASNHENGGSDEIDVAGLSGELADAQPPKTHDLGGTAHSADTLANLNTKVSDATLVDATAISNEIDGDVATHEALTTGVHGVGTSTVDSVSARDSAISTHAGNPSVHHVKYTDAEAVTAMGVKADVNPLNHDKYTLEAHASNHTDGTDDIQNATDSQKGLATAAQITKLDSIEAGATADQTGSEIVTLLEALGAGNQLSHTKLDDIGAGDHHVKYTDAEAVAAAKADADVADAIAKKHTQNTDTDLSPAHKDATTGVHGVGAGTVAKTADITATKLDDFTAPDDNTDLDATTAKHGLMPKADKSKLDGVEAGATANQTGAEIKSLYEGEADTNAYTDAEKTKLAGIETGATKYPDTGEQAFLDADHTKLDGIEAGADVTDSTNVDDAGAVMESDYNANTILHATSDNTPVAEDFRFVLAKRMPTTVYYEWRNTDLFTLTTTGSGSGSIYTIKNYLLGTGTTLNSIARLTSDDIFWIDKDYDVSRFEWTTTMSVRTADCEGQSIWIGLMETPATPSTTQKHVAFYVDTNGDIYASCGNGTSGTQTDTGLNVSLNVVFVLLIVYGASDVKFYVDNVLKATITTNIPDGFGSYMNFFIQTLEEVDKRVFAGNWHLRGTA